MTDAEFETFMRSLTEADLAHGLAFVAGYAPAVFAEVVASIERHRAEQVAL